MNHRNLGVSFVLAIGIVSGAQERVQAAVLPPDLPHSFESGNNYLAEWGLTSDGLLAMRLSAETTGWVGIGFSEDRSMPQSDIVTGAAASDGSFSYVQDRFATGRFEPAIDAQQDIEVLSATHVDGVTSIEFLRPLTSTDTVSDFDLALGPYYLLYAWGGSALSSGRITHHTSRLVSSQPFDFTTAQVIADFPPPIEGDFNRDGVLDVLDIDQLTGVVQAATNDPQFDLNADGLVDDQDRRVWVNDLKGTYFGDSNLDGEFNSTDLVDVLSAGTYEVAIGSSWATGDYDGNGFTDSSDLVAALADGGYEQGPRPATSAVPEPGGTLLLSLGLFAFNARRRRNTGRCLVSTASASMNNTFGIDRRPGGET
jgi:hypothetical protein